MGRMILISGFLGAGKTTLIRRILEQASGQRIALLENEFGTCGVDDLLLKDSGVTLQALTSGCVCCSLALDFARAVDELARTCQPDLLLVEPSGVAGLSDILRGCATLPHGLDQVSAITVVDAQMHGEYAQDMGDFYLDQIHNCGALVCSKLDLVSREEAGRLVEELSGENPGADIFCCPWEDLDIPTLLETPPAVLPGGGHHHHHHAGQVFTSLALHPEGEWQAGVLEQRLLALGDPACGRVLRAKGIVQGPGGTWLQADYTPGQAYLHPWEGEPGSVLTVIGTRLDQGRIEALFT